MKFYYNKDGRPVNVLSDDLKKRECEIQNLVKHGFISDEVAERLRAEVRN